MRWLRQLCLALAGATAAYACAFPEFEFEEDDDTGGGAGASTSTGGAPQGGDGPGATTSAGGAIPCTLRPDSCEDGQRCTLIDESIGVPGGTMCVAAPLPIDTHPIWSRCDQHTECAKESICDARTNICRPLCTAPGDCAGGGTCIPAPRKDGSGTIPGVEFCTANCHPMQGTPCNDAFGATTCLYESPRTDCARSAGKTYGDQCSTLFDCGKGTLCIDDPTVGKFCGLICTPFGQTAQCSGAFNTCTTPQFSHNSTSYGVCLY
jgi:hypothetical protein